MLVLSRKPGERILIGDHITITVVKMTNGGVRLGIEAPHEMPIVREELKIAMEKQQALDAATNSNVNNEATRQKR